MTGDFPELYNVVTQHDFKVDKHAALRCTRLRQCLDAFHQVAKYQKMSFETMARLMEKGWLRFGVGVEAAAATLPLNAV